MGTSQQPVLGPAGLFAGYPVAPHGFDEAFDAGGRPRPHWDTLVQAMDRYSSRDWQERAETLRRLQRDYSLPAAPGERQAPPWGFELDLVPLVISPAEWACLEPALIQRARLWTALLADCLGPRRCPAEGVFPSALLYANPAFLRPCTGLAAGANPPLFMIACDLVRSRAGQWSVLSDYTRIPHGAGPALQHRMTLSRVLTEEFRSNPVHRLAGFFQKARDWLRGLAAENRAYPLVALLTPGPGNPAWPEHAFLARYLGFALVEGADLTVRDRRVFIKTLEGLQPVDVILRYLDDNLCDPLELRSDSVVGVPGLLEAIRGGKAAVANLPGASLLEANAWFACLPALCHRLLGEPLLLPGVGTWWCGDPDGLAYVTEHLGELVIRPAFQGLGRRITWPQNLTSERRRRLLRAIRENPHEFVGQSIIDTATTPSLVRGRLEPRPYVLRMFLAAQGNQWSVMPGGLALLLEEAEGDSGIPIASGAAKDVWVLSPDAVAPATLLSPASQVVRPERSASQMPSRVADNLFWLGRYAERLEDMIRVLRCALARLAEETGREMSPELVALTRLLVQLDLLPQRCWDPPPADALQKELLQLVYQTHSLGTVREVLGRLRQIAFALRDRFSGDTWLILARLNEEAARPPAGVPAAQALNLLNNLVVHLAAFSGMEMENMTRGHGWRFLDIGRRLERAINATTLAQAGLALGNPPASTLEAMLEIADSVMTYRRRYFAQPEWGPVLDLLLADDTNPRALAFQLQALKNHGQELPRETSSTGFSLDRLRALEQQLEQADWPALVAGRREAGGHALDQLLQALGTSLRETSNELTHVYFNHAGMQVN